MPELEYVGKKVKVFNKDVEHEDRKELCEGEIYRVIIHPNQITYFEVLDTDGHFHSVACTLAQILSKD